MLLTSLLKQFMSASQRLQLTSIQSGGGHGLTADRASPKDGDRELDGVGGAGDQADQGHVAGPDLRVLGNRALHASGVKRQVLHVPLEVNWV